MGGTWRYPPDIGNGDPYGACLVTLSVAQNEHRAGAGIAPDRRPRVTSVAVGDVAHLALLWTTNRPERRRRSHGSPTRNCQLMRLPNRSVSALYRCCRSPQPSYLRHAHQASERRLLKSVVDEAPFLGLPDDIARLAVQRLMTCDVRWRSYDRAARIWQRTATGHGCTRGLSPRQWRP